MIYVTHDQVEAMTMADRIAVIKDGVLQQVAPPLTLYNQPSNRFVASFIGSPAMNFIEGTIEIGAFEAAALRFPLEGPHRDLGFPSGPVTLGIRPEDLDIVGAAVPGEPEAGTVLIEATAVEPMGNEIFLHGAFEGGQLQARIGPETLPEVGKTYRLRLDAARAHLFDAETEASLNRLTPVP
jgi:multiple sugar transport system ATP-binding protein